MERFFIIDAMALAFRSFHAFSQRPLSTSKGLPTSAVYGSAMFLLKLLEEQRPQYWCVATDTKEPTFRHKKYDLYKANRSLMPEDLSLQIPYIYRLFECLGMQLLRKPGFEADDLIATLIELYKGQSTQFMIVSGDKDLMQLVNSTVFLFTPKKGDAAVIVDENSVREKFGCTPSQIRDVLAIIGDTSDNVPGVHGIGEKGAAKLIGEYHNLEGIYKNLDNIQNPKHRLTLESSKEQAFLSRDLVTLDRHVPLEVEFESFKAKPRHEIRDALVNLFQELEFRVLVERVSAWEQKNATAPKKLGQQDLFQNDQKHVDPGEPALVLLTDEKIKELSEHYHCITTQKELDELLAKIKTSARFAIDTETTGLDKVADIPIGMSFSFQKNEAYYLPIHGKHTPLDVSDVIARVKTALTETKAIKIAHNIKFDAQMLNNIGITLDGAIADTMLMAHLLDPLSRDYSLDACSLAKFKYQKIPTSHLIGKNAAATMLDVELPILSCYACEDADFTLRLYECLHSELAKLDLVSVHDKIEAPLSMVLGKMEQLGVNIDMDTLTELSGILAVKAEELTEKIFKEAGEVFNINSTKQLAVILFEKLKVHELLGIKKIKKTQSGYSTDVSVLEKLSAHPLPGAILEFRTVMKLKNTYVDTLPQLIHPKTQRVHTSFHQAITATGRLSSADPNLQNIPIRSEMGRQIRRAFRASQKNWVIMSADYSQVELRILAHLTEDVALSEAFKQDLDIHTDTASRVFGVPVQEVTANLRSKAKAINFGIIYGMGPQRLARDTGLTMDEAKKFIARYFAAYPKIEEYIDNSIDFARKHGYSVTMTGRRRPVPELASKEAQVQAFGQNIAVNSPVQGSAADLIKLAMITIDNSADFRQTGARMLLQVHDELVFECPKSEAEAVKKIVKYAMEHAMQLKVPLRVDIGYGEDWLEAHA